jgi:NAD(P)-dependent dehydrogenase (short-subunit alcohol dehydrogenase family)
MLLKLILFVLIPYAILLSILLARKAPQRKTTKPISRGWGNRLRILIVGATGGSGRELVRQALEQGHQVTAFVRKPKKMKIEHPNLRITKGNVGDYASLEEAMRGQSAVLCALGTKHFFYPSRVLSNGTANILRAMKSCGVPSSGLRKFARNWKQRRPARPALHILCCSTDFAFHFLR